VGDGATYFLGVDIGTSGVKAVIVDDRGSVLSQATAPLSVSRPQPLWSEQVACDWWSATEAAIVQLDARLRAGVQGIGLAGQMHGATLLGADDKLLRPAILWNDGRSFAECVELEAKIPLARVITGNIAMPGFTAPKLLWIKHHEPDIFAQIKSVLLPKDYIRLCMTGNKASDVSDSAGTFWLDTDQRAWSEPMLAACGLTSEQMPRLYEGNQVTGHLRPEIAARWGMKPVPVAGGAGDQAAGAAGVGAVRDGDAFLSLGTSGVVFVATDSFRPNPARAVHAFCHCVPGMWHQMSVHLSAASCIDWGARLIGTDARGIFALAEKSGAGSGAELFLPYLSGERTPHNDAHIRGAFLGLDNESDPGRVANAVLEGVAFAHADGLTALREAGTAIEELSVIGGGSRSLYWGRIIAAALGVRLAYLEGGEVGPALGSAKLAQMAVTGGNASDVCTRPPISRIVESDPILAEQLAPKRARFRSAYLALKSMQEPFDVS
jgi:xylulokinase